MAGRVIHSERYLMHSCVPSFMRRTKRACLVGFFIVAVFSSAQVARAQIETIALSGDLWSNTPSPTFFQALEYVDLNNRGDMAVTVELAQSEDGDATSINVFDDELMLINMSVWDSIESLRAFVYRTVHVELIQDREAWFSKMAMAHQTLWWIPKGHIPTEEEGKERLAHIREHGPSQEAFTFGRPFPKP